MIRCTFYIISKMNDSNDITSFLKAIRAISKSYVHTVNHRVLLSKLSPLGCVILMHDYYHYHKCPVPYSNIIDKYSIAYDDTIQKQLIIYSQVLMCTSISLIKALIYLVSTKSNVVGHHVNKSHHCVREVQVFFKDIGK